MRTFLATVPLFLPGVILSIGVAAIASGWLGRILGTSRAIAFLLIASVGLIVSATLTPDLPALADGTGSDRICDLGRIGLPSLRELATINPTSLNVLLFVPLGLSVGLLPASGRTLLVVLLALMLPVAVEGIQLTVTALGRGCQSADVIDNSLGLVIGLALAGAIRTIGRVGTTS